MGPALGNVASLVRTLTGPFFLPNFFFFRGVTCMVFFLEGRMGGSRYVWLLLPPRFDSNSTGGGGGRGRLSGVPSHAQSSLYDPEFT